MAGITDMPFRKYMKRLGAGVVVSELVSAHGINYKSEKTFLLTKYHESERPIGIQLFGETPEAIAEAAKIMEQTGVDFIDLNFGCPVKKVVCKGAGSALLKDLTQLRKVLGVVRSSIKIPLTIKIRTGWDHNSKNAHEVCQIAYDEGVTWVAIHGRTRSQAYEGLSDWDYIADVKAKSNIAIIGNGDITSAQEAVERLNGSSCDAVMIGRGCLKSPWIFKEAEELLAGRSSLAKKSFYQLLMELSAEYSQSGDEKYQAVQLKKFSSWYSAGFPGSAHFRKNIFAKTNLIETKEEIKKYFLTIDENGLRENSDDLLIKSGHG